MNKEMSRCDGEGLEAGALPRTPPSGGACGGPFKPSGGACGGPFSALALVPSRRFDETRHGDKE